MYKTIVEVGARPNNKLWNIQGTSISIGHRGKNIAKEMEH